MSAKRITWTARVGQVAMLERAAATLNNVPWCQSDNTAETVFDEFIKPCINDIFDDVEMFIENIYHGIDTGEDEGSRAHFDKVLQLEVALREAFKGKAAKA